LNCGQTRVTGIETFVGGASDGQIGVAAMKYTNPITRQLTWQKTWFFLDDDVQHVMVGNITSQSMAPVYSVLDQKRRKGGIFIDSLDKEKTISSQASFHHGVRVLWHDGVGYTFNPDDAVTLSVQAGKKTGNWTSIGTSVQPPITVDLFAAWLQHNSLNNSISYTVFPGTDRRSFTQKQHSVNLQTIRNDANTSAVFDQRNNVIMAVFWAKTGGSISVATPPHTGGDKTSPFILSTQGNIAVIYSLQSCTITVADPSQSLANVQVTLTAEKGGRTRHCGSGNHTLSFTLPQGGLAGSSVSQQIR
jgi:hypothetical protein